MKSIGRILVALLAMQATAQLIGRAHCTSSYIDDYFLPTAKLALNKIQQSFSPPQPSTSTSNTDNKTTIEQDITTTTTTTTTTKSTPQQQTEPANAIDRQQLLTNAANNVIQEASQQQQREESTSIGYYQPASKEDQPQTSAVPADRADPVTLTISSSESVSTDPSSGIATSNDMDSATATATGSPAPSSTVGSNQDLTGEEQPQIAAETPAQSVNSIEPALVVVEAAAPKPTEEASSSSSSSAAANFREAELEAIAAVDESIAFGDLMQSRDSIDTCYDEYGNARFCEPEFENVAFERPVEVSSECGSPATRFCTTTYATLNERNDQIRNCHICDAHHSKKRHPAAYLTDINNSNNPTCWVSAPIGLKPSAAAAGSAVSGNQSVDNQQAPPPPLSLQRDNVSLTLSMGKSYEITYISLQFCSPKPDSLAIYKSNSNGLLWTPYQFYSSQCKQMYGMEPSTPGKAATPFEAICLNSSAIGASNTNQPLNSGRIAFSTLEGHSQRSADHLQADATAPQHLSDWISATDIRIVLDRHQASWIQSSLAVHSHHSHSAGNSSTAINNKQPQAAATVTTTSGKLTDNELQSTESNANQLTNPSDTYNYALSDVTVGGRCKCNGHAQRCVHGEDGQLRCDCRHNTSGRDCERCAPFHFDRPWQPASQMDANPCQPCQCNGHSRRCRFDPALYQSSGRRSGGVCIACRDNTDGRHCNYCREGFTRDHSKPMSDKEACKPCNCHPLGSSGRVCDQTSGQCPCKEGVTGLECTRCAPGYQQSSSPSEPCIKLPENDINSYEPIIEPTDQDNTDNVQAVNSADQDNSPARPAGGQADPSATSRFKQPPTGHKTPMPDVDASPADAKDFLDQDNASRGNVDDMDQADRQQQQQQQFNAMKARNQQPRYQINANNQWNTGRRPQSRQDSYYYNKRFDRPRHLQFTEPDLEDPMDDYGGGSGGEQPNYRPQAGYNQMMPTYGKPQRPFTGNGNGNGLGKPNNKAPTRSGGPNLVQMQPMPVDDVNSVDEPAASSGYAPQNPMLIDQTASNSASVDSMDDTSFNHIQSPNSNHKRPPLHTTTGGHPFSRPIGGRPYNSYNNNNNHHQRHPYNGQASSKRRFQDTFEPTMQQQPPVPYPFQHQPALSQANGVTCADCQSATRKFTRRQFCHLDYAIKAQVLSRDMAEDWTRYEVEIQDIFKSPQQNLRPPSQLDENSLQSDDPNVVGGGSPAVAVNETSSSGQSPSNDQQASVQSSLPLPQQPAAPQTRMKIGSIQSIWVPTEDVTCKCPRLKLKSTYLLLGLVDKSENSPTSIQLDRHGVALEWKPSLQERLIKYQRRQSRKGCQ